MAKYKDGTHYLILNVWGGDGGKVSGLIRMRKSISVIDLLYGLCWGIATLCSLKSIFVGGLADITLASKSAPKEKSAKGAAIIKYRR